MVTSACLGQSWAYIASPIGAAPEPPVPDRPVAPHGIARWALMRAKGLKLAIKTCANRHVVELISFHESRRLNEHIDDGHVVRCEALGSVAGAKPACSVQGTCP